MTALAFGRSFDDSFWKTHLVGSQAEDQDWERPELLALVKDLFQLSADNRAFLAAQLLADKTDGVVVDVVRIAPYRERIESALFEKAGWPRDNLQFTDARKAITFKDEACRAYQERGVSYATKKYLKR